jgi:hypothetical protein
MQFESGAPIMNGPLDLLELDERLTRFWLTCNLPLEKRIKMKEHLEVIRLTRLELLRRPAA